MQCTVNGLSGERRSARPVRLALSSDLSADIGGAWWPYTASVAGELPNLVEVLHPSFGEILQMCVSWTSLQGAPELVTRTYGGADALHGKRTQHRLMRVVGRSAEAMLLVVPHMTSHALGTMVMRRASARPTQFTDQNANVVQAADTVLRAAEAQSATWTSSLAR
jgi:hypothetical protein